MKYIDGGPGPVRGAIKAMMATIKKWLGWKPAKS
jgi:hypothetical protein